MNLHHIFGELEKADPEIYERLDTRRGTMKSFAGIGKKLTLAAIPLALGSMFQKAYAGTTILADTAIDILNYALTLEYLESEFYSTGNGKGTALIPAGAGATALTTIGAHEAAHVAFLTAAIKGLSGTPVPKPTFDFTTPFPDVFISYDTFLAVAQVFEDTGVRAYKGRAAELVKGGDLLTAALNIHSVEARHASHIRQMRKGRGVDIKPWITGTVNGSIGAGVNTSYAGEDNTVQATIQIVNINGMGTSTNAATEAFDEGLSKDAVLAIVNQFIKK